MIIGYKGEIMKIEQSEVSYLTSHQKHKEVQESESLKVWNSKEDSPEQFRQKDKVEFTEKFKKLFGETSDMSKIENDLEDISLSPKLMSIVRALESLTGKKINISFMHKLEPTQTDEAKELKNPEESTQEVGWGIDYNYERTEIHEESLKFSAQGNVKTQDGNSIDFSLAFSMQSSSKIHESISLKAGDALIDPLVLNFGADVITISDIKHDFDLDLNGKSDTFSFVGSGSGFLALDKNNDGFINDGSELFGPTLGNGFEELSAYDDDGNNWIDENDAIFNQLVIWTKDEQNKEHIFSLKDKNVGALYLNSAQTPFELKNSNGNSQALMKESSIYLKENGGVSTLQEIDLKI
jgi:hypothetical protein